jgi:hypothetical protein
MVLPNCFYEMRYHKMILCGHCGTRINEGFNVCTGCGARLERNYRGIVLSLIFFGPITLVLFSALSEQIDRGNKNIFGLICLIIIICIIELLCLFKSFKLRWVLRYQR